MIGLGSPRFPPDFGELFMVNGLEHGVVRPTRPREMGIGSVVIGSFSPNSKDGKDFSEEINFG
jgi:hypothetical protein